MNLVLIIICTFPATFVPHRAQNVLQTQHFVLWLLFPRILHLRRICISRKIASELLHVNRNWRESCFWPTAKRTLFCSLDDINNHEGDILMLHICIKEEKVLESELQLLQLLGSLGKEPGQVYFSLFALLFWHSGLLIIISIFISLKGCSIIMHNENSHLFYASVYF